MAGGDKRKDAPGGAGGRDDGRKKKKTGNDGKWKTAHHEAKKLDLLQPGDQGIWVSCARRQEAKATREVCQLFTEYLEKMYGIKDKDDAGSDDEDVDDIEAAVKKEAAALKVKGTKDAVDEYFTPLKMNVDCLVFFKTKAPIQPIEFVKRICSDAQGPKQSGQFRCRYVNRLTPVTHIGKANKTGVMEVAKKALAPHFKLSAKATAPRADESAPGDENEGREESGEEPASEKPQAEASGVEDTPAQDIEPVTFAVRPSIRNHTTLQRSYVIEETAGLIDQEYHKVKLSSPDKVLLIEIYQTVCGMSVVGSDWEELKKYNLSELYGESAKTDKKEARESTEAA
ncbi:hypothetical protein QBC39DRAFT_187409 [Podospora conica]|nr:hypothetical protein QBC39DRAFT_187409 [Schizothecium conicum]